MPLMFFIAIALGTALLTTPGTPPALLFGLAMVAFTIVLFWLLGNLFYPLLVKHGWVR